MEDRVVKHDIVARVARLSGLRQVDVRKAVNGFLRGVVDAMAKAPRLELRNFGVFEVRHRKARRARNPRTGEEVQVPARNVVVFRPGRLMREKIR
jgi:nucleoid DNA-binding protein